MTLSRLYRDDDQWKDSSSFGRDDLPLVSKVADQVHTWIYQQHANGEGGPPEAAHPLDSIHRPRKTTGSRKAKAATPF